MPASPATRPATPHPWRYSVEMMPREWASASAPSQPPPPMPESSRRFRGECRRGAQRPPPLKRTRLASLNELTTALGNCLPSALAWAMRLGRVLPSWTYARQCLYEAVRHTGMLYALQPAYLWWAFRCRYTALLDRLQEVGYTLSFDAVFREVRAVPPARCPTVQTAHGYHQAPSSWRFLHHSAGSVSSDECTRFWVVCGHPRADLCTTVRLRQDPTRARVPGGFTQGGARHRSRCIVAQAGRFALQRCLRAACWSLVAGGCVEGRRLCGSARN